MKGPNHRPEDLGEPSITSRNSGEQDVHRRVEDVTHKEVEDKIQECLLELHALPEGNIGLLETDGEERGARREREAGSALLKDEPWEGT